MTQDITNTVQKFFAAIDKRDWDGAESLMTNPFHLDYSSFGAPEGADLVPIDILTGWKAMLPGFDQTHHQLGPLDITQDGSSATVQAYVTATHQITEAEGGELWTVYGSYVLTLVNDGGWKLSGNTFTFKFLQGNANLPAMAQERAA
ncbi:nuclear transport factor 2 family protein [Ruegeria arenilitoris]|uniref:nuclear transport factor 2 family protein n=1 Tax=Ruegeria arenilitoris TaxID=1173585 RepID=UPI00147E6A92|nr:nuclear transport factor 2 family protein [Ruegeria arenilitoris]